MTNNKNKVKSITSIPPIKGGVEPLKILFIDIETAPILGHVWKLWDNNVGLNQIEKDWHILSVTTKWKGVEHEPVYWDTSKQKNIENDRTLCLHIQKLLDEADVVVAHNGRKFDVKKLYARFILNNIPPPSPFTIVDTLETAKSKFGFTSNKLEYLSDKLCKTKKLTKRKFSGHELWMEIITNRCGERVAAWAEMKEYNIIDVIVLEELYNIFLPWMDNHPNVNIKQIDDVVRCPRCGGTHLQKRGTVTRLIGEYHKYHCQSCGRWSTGRSTCTPPLVRKALLK